MERISERIYFVEGKNRGKFPFCDCLLVENVLIDAGAGTDILREIAAKVEKVILSHTHPDHSSGAWVFNEIGKPVLSPEGFKTDLDSLAVRFVGEELADYWKNFICSSTGMKSFTSEKYSNGEILNKQPEIVAYGLSGHTDDMHVFLIEGKILYGADIDLTSFGPWYGNPESNPEVFRKSIEKIPDFDAEIFISSHEKPVIGKENIEDRVNRYLEVFDRRDRKIMEILKEPKTIEELVEISPFYGRKPYAKKMLDFFERMMIEKHLNVLMKRGKVIKIGEKFVANEGVQ
jgi:glyoxylase-like metal-dependent hydrolase (beta-lactamase superfamily II)